ncbi:unnamed protein product [Eruca vesicaria subsp. sativa]|uniref:Uncharacterized protein n=1 Tax=Eruca vesicaria subsp. sativa TaxID=29727 RepID=A0ABC8IP12_ERUVS|nr:unnamed protein product [Eruca vesicaria subsp. sativa]
MAAATETSSSASSVVDLRPLSPSLQRLENLILHLKRPSTTTTSLLSTRKRRKCPLCTPTTHPRPFRCESHRVSTNENIETLASKPKRSRSSITTTTSSSSSSGSDKKIGILGLRLKRRRRCCPTTSDSGLNLRKTALMNSLAGIGSVEAERCRKYLKESLVKPLSPRFRCKYRPRPRRSRFYALRNDQD